jgi:diadenosine tetraphosphate (Ap4A) HIT family hydrolase
MLDFCASNCEFCIMNTTCKFCDKFAVVRSARNAWDQVLFESPNFVVVPTVGSIVPGWLLILPRKHFLCVGAMGDAMIQEMLDLRRRAAASLRVEFGPVTFFEHGPAEPGTSVGCGVDHAHLHLVATRINLVEGAQQVLQEPLTWASVGGLEATATSFARKTSYLYVELANGKAWIGTGNRIGSQAFRKVIAAASGRTEAFDWKCHAFETNIQETIRAVERWKASAQA